MKKEKNNSATKKELIPIPDYEFLQERETCKNCKYYYDCKLRSGNITSAKIHCMKTAKKFHTICFSIFAIIEILGVIFINVKTEELYSKIAYSLAYLIFLFLTEKVIWHIAKTTSEVNERKRRNSYNLKVEEILRVNEKIRKENRGKTEEYDEFIKCVDEVKRKINDKYRTILRMDFSDEFSEDKDSKIDRNSVVAQSLKKLCEKIEKLSGKITAKNFNTNSVQAFYKMHLESFAEKTQSYINLYTNSKLTVRQMNEFNELINFLIQKVEDQISIFEKIEEENFISDINSFKEAINTTKNEENKGSEE